MNEVVVKCVWGLDFSVTSSQAFGSTFGAFDLSKVWKCPTKVEKFSIYERSIEDPAAIGAYEPLTLFH